MPLCRVAVQSLASRFTRAAPLLRGQEIEQSHLKTGVPAYSSFGNGKVPFRQMSSGSVPGSSGKNLICGLFVVGATGAGFFYAYKVIVSDKERYSERIEQIQQRNTEEWKPKPWPPPSLESDETETEEVTDTNEDAKEAAAEETEEVTAGESQVQSGEHAESTESEKGEESAAEEATSGVPGGEQEAPANSEANQDQG